MTELPKWGCPAAPNTILILTQAAAAKRPRRRRPGPAAPRGNPGRARGRAAGGGAEQGTAGAGPARSKAELGKEAEPNCSAGPSPLLRPRTRAVPLNLASLHAMPIQPWSAPLIPAAWGQPEAPNWV